MVLDAHLEEVEVASTAADRLAAAGATRDDEGVTVRGFPGRHPGATKLGYFASPLDGETARAARKAAARRAKARSG